MSFKQEKPTLRAFDKLTEASAALVCLTSIGGAGCRLIEGAIDENLTGLNVLETGLIVFLSYLVNSLLHDPKDFADSQ